MNGHSWELFVLCIGAVVTGLAGAVINALFKAKADQGRRIGRLEKSMDFERGRRAGLREAQKRARNGGHGR